MKIGSTVTLVYTGTLEDGTVFGSATTDTPMVFQTGMELTIPGFEKEVLEMNEVGEKRTFTVGMYDAYGEHLDEHIQNIPLELIPYDVKPGKRILLGYDGGNHPCTCIDVVENEAVVDLNHPLAGHDLTFEVEIIALEDAPEGFVSEAERRAERERMEKMLGGGM